MARAALEVTTRIMMGILKGEPEGEANIMKETMAMMDSSMSNGQSNRIIYSYRVKMK